MTIIVTGGAGFIGQHVMQTLQDMGLAARAFDIKNNCLHTIGSASALEQAFAHATGVIHLAAVASVPECTAHRYASAQINIMGTLNVFEIATRCNIPVVYASSAAVYGAAEAIALSEDIAPRPTSGYGADKATNEMHAQTMPQLRALGLRLFNVYGAGQSPSSVISAFKQAIAAGRPLTLYGNGAQTRDFVHVQDVAHMFVQTLRLLQQNAALPPVLNVGTGEEVSLQQLVTLMGGTNTVHAPARQGDIARSVSCTKRRAQYMPKMVFTRLGAGLG